MSHTTFLPRFILCLSLSAAILVPAAPVSTSTDIWTHCGPGDEMIVHLAIDPVTPGTLYATTALNGVFKSTDSGESWNPINNGLPVVSGGPIAIDPLTPSTLYVVVYNTYSGGIFKSTNGGVNWNLASTGLTTKMVDALVIDPHTPSILYAGTMGGGVFKSTNSGGSWSPVGTGLTLDYDYIQALAIDPAASATLYAGSNGGGVYKSTNGGANWSQLNTGLTHRDVHTLAVDPLTPATLYVGTFGGAFKSTDGAQSWNLVNTGLGDLPDVSAFVIDPANPAHVYAATHRGIFKSTDAAASWNLFNTGMAVADFPALVLDSTRSGMLYAGMWGGGAYSRPLLTLDWVNTDLGLSSGGTLITLHGEYFMPGAAVTLGSGAALSVTVVNATRLTAITPPHAAGAVDVVVTNPDTNTVTLPGGFIYADTIDQTYLPLVQH